MSNNARQQFNHKKHNKKTWIAISVMTGVIAIISVLLHVLLIAPLNNKHLVAERAHVNYAWGFSYSGRAIFDDGTIYEWSPPDDGQNDGNYDILQTREGRGNWILKHGTRIDKVVSEKDMDKIKKGIYALKDTTYEKKNYMFDAGSSYVSVWRNDEEIILKESGDWQGENQTKEAQDLINIINKYLQDNN